jgi:hypothetical protein
MGFKSFSNDLGKGSIKAAKDALGIAGDPEEISAEDAKLKKQIDETSGVDWTLVDLENPDGVINEFVKSNIKNIIKGSAIQKSNLESTSTNSRPIPFAEPADGKKSYYVKDVDSMKYKSTAAGGTNKKGHNKDGTTKGAEISEGARPYSIFNRFSLVNYRGNQLTGVSKGYDSTSGQYHKINQEELVNPSASKIIEITSRDGENRGYKYDYSDFALARYYGKIANNQMITLRRFAFPVTDDIITPKILGDNGKMIDNKHPDIARAITFLGETPGNKIEDILKFTHGYKWKNAEADVQTLQSQRGQSGGKFGALVNGSTFLSAASNASAGKDAVASNSAEKNAGYDAFSNTYPNHVFGPLNVIKDTLVREKGLTFEQEFTLRFEYELRSFGGVNPKIMMLDQMANILALTFNTAPFWGGAVRYTGGGGAARPLGDLAKLKSGDYTGFLGSVMKDMGSMFKSVGTGISNLMKGKDSKLLNNLVGGSLMKMFNTPQGGQAANALLTGDPTGAWHVTIGNPLNPIMVVGNLTCQSTDIHFEGGTGVQDFPERMVVTIKLKPGRPRDRAEIESMFNAGRGRFYLTPNDGVDINETSDTSAYGNKDRKGNAYVDKFRKLATG